MSTVKWCTSLLVVLLLTSSGTLLAQHRAVDGGMDLSFTMTTIVGLLELPFLFLCVYFAFRTARALKGGIFGTGMMLIAAGFLVMAVGHVHMQIIQFTGVDLFATLFGNLGGSVAWVIALVVTWGLSGVGFYKIYNVSRTV